MTDVRKGTAKRLDLPLTFRQEKVDSILSLVTAGESCTLVGIGSVGKSNLLRFLQREDVIHAKLGQESADYLFVYIDANKLLKRSLWGLAELMLHQLVISLTERSIGKQDLNRIDSLYQRATERSTRHLALRYLDRAVAFICRQLGLCVVFLIDEFDELWQILPSRGFAALRALRDDHKYRLVYIVAGRLELSRLTPTSSGMEAFEELISGNVIWLGPYSEADARFVLHRLRQRYSVPLKESNTNELLAVTGGHPGLLRAGCQAMEENTDNLEAVLLSSPQIQDECRRIWFSLTQEEQSVVAQIAFHNDARSKIINLSQLQLKGLIGGSWVNSNDIFSPLFAAYIRQYQPVVGVHITVDRECRIVWVNEHAVRDLSRLEFAFIDCLDQKRGSVCSRDELASHLYPEDTALDGKGVSDARLDAIARRVRDKIEPAPTRPRYIVTVRGHGYRLMDHIESES